MIHTDRGGNSWAAESFFGRLEGNVEYDYMGLSYYSFYHGPISNFENNINNLYEKFGKPVIVAETSYAYTTESSAFNSSIFAGAGGSKAWPVTPEGQANSVGDIAKKLAALPDGAGAGIFYWEAAWLPVSGAGWAQSGTLGTWADQAFFSYDGVALPSLNVYNLLKGTD
jgi:arabinogalactan endo-1,4-beta-galactosidase